MDRERFDALARLLATTGSRRATLGALLGASLLSQSPDLLAKPGKGKGKTKDRKRRKKRGHTGNDGGQNPGPSPEPCCGTKRCADPEHGSTRSDCDFAGRSFAGQDLNGSIFRGIDGRFADFTDADLRGSVFAEACLFQASFRGARLGGSTWGDACLFAADFTDARLGDADALDGAVLCGTIMPDGARNDRDCGALPRCCQSALGGSGPCTGPNDCPDVPCRTKACDDGACVYTPVGDGPSPNGLCDTHCCGITCCASAAAVCFQGRCCVPSGPFDCGRDRCTDACPGCDFCVTFADGSSQCAVGGVAASCAPCPPTGNCTEMFLPACIVSITNRRTKQTVTVGEECRNPSLQSSCAGFNQCRPS